MHKFEAKMMERWSGFNIFVEKFYKKSASLSISLKSLQFAPIG